MDCANGGDLHAYITRRPAMRLCEEEARWFFQQLVVGLDYCHRCALGSQVWMGGQEWEAAALPSSGRCHSHRRACTEQHAWLCAVPSYRRTAWEEGILIPPFPFSDTGSRGVANRDLKLENLLLDSADSPRPILKMCDFGYSKHELNSLPKTSVGTTCYMAPEVYLGYTTYDAKVADIWSLGIILFAMLFGAFPFKGRDKRYIQAVLLGRYAIPPDVQVCHWDEHAFTGVRGGESGLP